MHHPCRPQVVAAGKTGLRVGAHHDADLGPTASAQNCSPGTAHGAKSLPNLLATAVKPAITHPAQSGFRTNVVQAMTTSSRPMVMMPPPQVARAKTSMPAIVATPLRGGQKGARA